MGCAVAGCPSEHCLHSTVAAIRFQSAKQSPFNKLPDLRELLNQAEEARAHKRVPVQSVAPMPLPLPVLVIWTANVSNVTIR